MSGANRRPVVRVYELGPVSNAHTLTGAHRHLLKVDVPYGTGSTSDVLDAL